MAAANLVNATEDGGTCARRQSTRPGPASAPSRAA